MTKTNANKSLQLVENKDLQREKEEIKEGGGSTPPPLSKRAVKVNNIAEAKKLLTRLMSRVQKEEIDPKQAGLLNYLISTFIQLQKYLDEREEFLTIVDAYFKYVLNRVEIQVDELKTIIANNVTEEELEKIKREYEKSSTALIKQVRDLYKEFVEIVTGKKFNKQFFKREEIEGTKIKAEILQLYKQLNFKDQTEIIQLLEQR